MSIKRLLFAVLFCQSATCAYAAVDILPALYLGVQMGMGQIILPTATGAGVSNSSGGFAYRLFGGYDYRITDSFHLGPEFGYMGYPNSSFNYTADGTTISAEYSGAALDALANAKYYFVNGFNVVGRLGVAYANQKVSINITQGSTSTPQSQQNSKLMPETGIGFGYDFNNGLGLNFTYNYLIGAHIDPSPNLEKFAPVSTYLIGLSYTFLS